MPNELVIASATDTQEIVTAAAGNDEAAARVSAPRPEMEKLDGSSVVSVEHPRSERTMLLERLAQHEAELEELTSPEADSEQVTSNETAEGEAGDSEPENIDIAEVRRVATADAIEAARRQQAERDSYYQQQQTQHLAPQAEIQALRAELLPAFQEKLKVLTASADAKQFQEAVSVPLRETLLDGLLCLPGGVETTAWLMQNPQEVRKLSALPEHMALVHIAKLANRFDPAAQRKPSNAPAPIRPIGGSATKSSVPPDDLPYQEFKKLREKQIAGRYRR